VAAYAAPGPGAGRTVFRGLWCRLKYSKREYENASTLHTKNKFKVDGDTGFLFVQSKPRPSRGQALKQFTNERRGIGGISAGNSASWQIVVKRERITDVIEISHRITSAIRCFSVLVKHIAIRKIL
jgi:hypothetical protein